MHNIRTFSEVLHLYCVGMGYKLSDAYVILKRKHVDVSQTSFYDYAKGTSVPTYEKALAIIKGLNIEVNKQSTIEKILLKSRQSPTYLETKGEKIYSLCGSYNIPWAQLFEENLTSAQARAIFTQRQKEVADSTSEYISALIRYDVKHHILPSKDKT